jgi:hypothetical protein
MSHLSDDYYINEENINKMANYFNAMDLFVNFTTDKTVEVKKSIELELELVA